MSKDSDLLAIDKDYQAQLRTIREAYDAEMSPFRTAMKTAQVAASAREKAASARAKRRWQERRGIVLGRTAPSYVATIDHVVHGRKVSLARLGA